MGQIGRAALKAYFETGDIPTEAQFIDLMDSIFNFTDDDSDDINESATKKFLDSSGDQSIAGSKVFDDDVEFLQDVSIADMLALGKAIAAFPLDVLGQSFFDGKATYVAASGSDVTAFNIGGVQQASLVNSVDDGFMIVPVAIEGRSNNHVILTQHTNKSKDHDHSSLSTHPTFFFHSNTDPDVDNTEWGSLSFIGDGAGGGYFQIDVGTGHVKIPANFEAKAIIQNALSADPDNPDPDQNVKWQSDGTGSGDDGDIMMKITDSGGTTKTTTLVDFSAI